MATLYDALQCLKPTSWDAVPQSSNELREYVRDIFKNSRLVAESLPDLPAYKNDTYPDGEFEAVAGSGPRVVPSSARVAETDPEITALQKQWGKPIKMGGPKENPLGVHVYKLTANDGGGQWFGRRSVHEGLSFARWRQKMASEYDETLKVNQKKIADGLTPDKSIRGIGAEEKVETFEVKDDENGDGSVLANVTVYHVSAQFPKPTAPRDFVALIITSEVGLQIGGTKQPGRSWMMVSRPCEHPDVPLKDGYTRGEYESVELIREIPKKRKEGSESSSSSRDESTKTKSKDKQKYNGADGANTQCPEELDEKNGALEDEDEEMNPVEWIMVTRSDPGGSIPRWMVDKGTPRSVGLDAAKFVNWAVQDDKPQRPAIHSRSASAKVSADALSTYNQESDDGDTSDSETDSTDLDEQQAHHGLIASVTGLLNTGLERYAPQAVLDYIPHHNELPDRTLDGSTVHQKILPSDAKSQSSGSVTKPTGLDSLKAHEPDHVSLSSARSEVPTPAIDEIAHNNVPPAELIQMTKTGKLSHHEKDLAKLALRKREVESKLDTIRAELDKLQIPMQQQGSSSPAPSKGLADIDGDTGAVRKRATETRSSTPTSAGTQKSQRAGGAASSDGQSSSTKTQTQTSTSEPPVRTHKAASQLFGEESKQLKQLSKIEASQLKLASKIEARQRKEAERSEKTRSKSEVENLRQEVGDLKKEVSRLRSERQKWVDLVASLQAENTKLAAEQEQK
ncbi:hypothetical protein NUU61_009156 [Penicillium alfredii]|uniref:DUF3074 domain-containing protein n=1 Tax=Penicillium alfredii TaxID=1506179 RepID=A0A9W9EML6_9EURO|nr:uncharacterized protein NUU61_009156 [Penicillium alfredii]KAJ5084577.1 hypothetical protein NUU61_009156 [Penicillium alfredii]